MTVFTQAPDEESGGIGNALADDVPPNIRNTAYEIAGAFYDQNRTPEFRKCAPDQDTFAIIFWPQFVPLAIDCLLTAATMTGIPESERALIADEITLFRSKSVAHSLSHLANKGLPCRIN